MANENWITRQTVSDEARRSYEQERLIIHTLEHISDALTEANVSRAQLAEALGTSKAYVTQLFNGQRNVTLRTLADLGWACGVRATISTEPLRSGEFVDTPVRLVSPTKPRLSIESSDPQDRTAPESEVLAA